MAARPISRQKLNRAIENFLRNGGVILKLEPERAMPSWQVGQRWTAYEPVLANTGSLFAGVPAPPPEASASR